MYDLCNAKPVDFIDALHSALRDFFIEFCEIRCAVRGHTPCPGSHAPPDWDAACGGRWSQDIVEQDDLLTVYQTHWLKYDLGSSLIDIACHYLNARMEAKTKSDHRMAAFVLPPATVRQVRCARTRGPRRLGRDRNGDASTLLPLTPGPRARTSARLLHRSPLSLSLSLSVQLALLAWQDKVVLAFHTRFGNRLLQQVFAQIEQDRLGNIANVAAAYDVIRSLGTELSGPTAASQSALRIDRLTNGRRLFASLPQPNCKPTAKAPSIGTALRNRSWPRPRRSLRVSRPRASPRCPCPITCGWCVATLTCSPPPSSFVADGARWGDRADAGGAPSGPRGAAQSRVHDTRHHSKGMQAETAAWIRAGSSGSWGTRVSGKGWGEGRDVSGKRRGEGRAVWGERLGEGSSGLGQRSG